MATTTPCRQIPVPPIVVDCYKSMFGYPPTHAILYQLMHHLETADTSLICAAIEYTALTAPRPTWAYANAVISRQLAKGSRTADDFNRDNEAFRRQSTYQPGFYKPVEKRVLAQQYSQRDWTGPEYADIDRMSPEDEALCATL